MWSKKAVTQGVRVIPFTIRKFSITSPCLNKLINVSVDDKTGIATLELNRPPVNSLNMALLQDINGALDELTRNRSKGLILTSVSAILSRQCDASVIPCTSTFTSHSHFDFLDFTKVLFIRIGYIGTS